MGWNGVDPDRDTWNDVGNYLGLPAGLGLSLHSLKGNGLVGRPVGYPDEEQWTVTNPMKRRPATTPTMLNCGHHTEQRNVIFTLFLISLFRCI